MQSYTLCDLDNKRTSCYTDCRYELPAPDHAPNHTTSTQSPIDVTSGYDNDFWQRCDADPISTSGQCPRDVAYYFRYPDHECCYVDDARSVEDVGSCCRTYRDWKSGCQTFYTVDGYSRSWSPIRDDVILDDGCYGMGYLSMWDGTGLENVEVLSAGGISQPSWKDSELAVPEVTGSRRRSQTGNGNRLTRSIETFKWMTVRRGSSKVVQTGLFTVLSLTFLYILQPFRNPYTMQ